MPWKLLIDPAHRPSATPLIAFYQPTFLYESFWDAGACMLLLWIDRRHHPKHGRLFALYLMIYTVGRSWIEALRDDHANTILGVRVNDWMSLIVFLGAATYLVATRHRARGEGGGAQREPVEYAATPRR